MTSMMSVQEQQIIYEKNKSWKAGDLIAFQSSFIGFLRSQEQYDTIIGFYIGADYKIKNIDELKEDRFSIDLYDLPTNLMFLDYVYDNRHYCQEIAYTPQKPEKIFKHFFYVVLIEDKIAMLDLYTEELLEYEIFKKFEV